jgi:hypothetical protein
VQLAARLVPGVNSNASAIMTVEAKLFKVVLIEVVLVKRKRISTSYPLSP